MNRKVDQKRSSRKEVAQPTGGRGPSLFIYIKENACPRSLSLSFVRSDQASQAKSTYTEPNPNLSRRRRHGRRDRHQAHFSRIPGPPCARRRQGGGRDRRRLLRARPAAPPRHAPARALLDLLVRQPAGQVQAGRMGELHPPHPHLLHRRGLLGVNPSYSSSSSQSHTQPVFGRIQFTPTAVTQVYDPNISLMLRGSRISKLCFAESIVSLNF